MKEGTEFYNHQIEVLPELYKDLAWEDPKTKLIWLPHTINEPNIGMVYASGTSIYDWKWAAVKSIPLEDKEEVKVKGQTHKIDMDTIKLFTEREYMDALSYIGLLPE